MNLLAFDTSTEKLSIAVYVQGQVLSFEQAAGAKASALILPKIHELLQEEQLKLADLDGIAFGAGPGAFTGVRVACGVAQGLGFGANLPVLGVNTLHALAQGFWQENTPVKLLVCVDARMDEIYFSALEKRDGNWHETIPATVTKPENAPMVQGDDWVGVGNGWQLFEGSLKAKYAQQVRNIYPNYSPSAHAILQLAEPIFAAGKAQPASQVRPIYIRNRVALTSAERAAGERM